MWVLIGRFNDMIVYRRRTTRRRGATDRRRRRWVGLRIARRRVEVALGVERLRRRRGGAEDETVAAGSAEL